MLRFNPTPFNVVDGLGQWALILGGFLLVALVVAYFIALATGGLRRGGIIRAFALTGRHLGQGLNEVFLVSPRRVWAITQLTIRESIRRKALLVFVVFALLFMFGGWFLTDSNDRPDLQANVHVTFVLKTVTFLTVMVVWLLACWGLPNDIKQRSLHTVVTKPVKRSEVVMGRMLGFAAIGTLILGVMAVAGHFWIRREVPPEAQGQLVSRVPIYGELEFTNREGDPGMGVNTGDIWEFRSYIEGATKASAIWTFENLTPDRMVEVIDPQTGEPQELLKDPETGEPQKMLQLESHFELFRTHKGEMGTGLFAQFKLLKDLRTQMAQTFGTSTDFQHLGELVQQGKFTEAADELDSRANGIETDQLRLSAGLFDSLAVRFLDFADLMEPFVESEAEFESASQFVSVARATSEAAQDKDADAFAARLKEMATLFRDNADLLAKHVVDVQTEVPFYLEIEDKQDGTMKLQRRQTLEVKEYRPNVFSVPRTISNLNPAASGSEKATLDVFDDLTHGNQLRVAVVCLDSQQYLGMARPDLFVRTPDRPFESGYYKAVAGTWLMMVLVVVLGVTASTFVKGPVATLLTLTLIVVGWGFHPFLEQLVTQKAGKGFGAIESVVRIVEHKNPQTELEASRAINFVKGTDKGITGGLWVIYKTVPDFNVFSLAPYVANGFDVPFNAGILPALATTLAYLIPCLLIGYFSLRLRELEAK